jgi:NAD(P)-dependent dehydrogenase (short-subunit alcohol dehydrogenase family)
MSQQVNLAGKIAVITGAGPGIGGSSARLLARHGARVHLADLNGPAAVTVVARSRRRVIATPAQLEGFSGSSELPG